ncbi:hypothetical protein TcCL_NonESM11030 [Trypanosoma cruzi]|nr:hypothetical protein TcCL_NonESM11030 [Trypanosoma cruzi]
MVHPVFCLWLRRCPYFVVCGVTLCRPRPLVAFARKRDFHGDALHSRLLFGDLVLPVLPVPRPVFPSVNTFIFAPFSPSDDGGDGDSASGGFDGTAGDNVGASFSLDGNVGSLSFVEPLVVAVGSAPPNSSLFSASIWFSSCLFSLSLPLPSTPIR